MSGKITSQATKSVRDAVNQLESAAEVYDGLEDASDLPQAFHEVAKALPTALQALKAIKSQLNRNPTADKELDKKAEKLQIDASRKFHSKAVQLYDIFDAVIPPGEGPRPARYRSAANQKGRVEVLMKEILVAVIVLAKPPIVTESLAGDLEKVLEEVANIPRSLEDDTGHSFHNYGSGPQSIHLGQGDQNINTGKGTQFNGKFMGPIHLPGSTP
ncbi:hypothetical protein CPLU01_07600 [Colletotrichum plurivorum]|uniref:NACHT-NTPase and P-loop NTPases N-terminal domain-containing protein n=1 Tax=Colletotrichum plurivorum TaxID=2175906 RepID=A0A8H6NEU6_9PEZI|nr:hypothetical protein CPLU01_07600 [Colletotrichum plurivorum]